MRSLLFIAAVILVSKQAFGATIKLDKVFNLNIPASAVSRDPDVFQADLNTTLECLRYTFETGLPGFFPSLVSIDLPAITLNLEDLGYDGTSGYISILGGVLNGITDFHAAKLDTTVLLFPPGFNIDATIVVPRFYLDFDYDMDMIANDIPVYGNGKTIIDWTDLRFEVNVFVGILTSVSISDLSIYITIGDSNVTITGWFNDEEHSKIVTDLVNDYLLPQWINDQPEYINEALAPIIESIINLLLAFLDLVGDVLGIFSAIANNCNLN